MPATGVEDRYNAACAVRTAGTERSRNQVNLPRQNVTVELHDVAGANGAHETLRTALATGIIIAFGVFIGGAAFFSGWAALQAMGVIVMTVTALFGWWCMLVEEGCRRTVMLLDAIHALCVALLDLSAGRGRTLWNWLVSFEGIGRRMHFDRIAFDDRAGVVPDF